MNKNSIILVAGNKTMEGISLLKKLQQQDFDNILTLDDNKLKELNIVDDFISQNKPEYVFLVGGKSGGIKANQVKPASLMIDNLKIITNTLSVSHKFGVKKLLYLGSSCSYPKYCEQPMKIDMLMTGALEPTSSSYAMSQLTGLELCSAYRKEFNDNFISAIPVNIFGPEDDFSSDNSHVIAALMKKTLKALKENQDTVEVWGSGNPKREFMYVDDLSDAIIFLMKNYNGPEPVNIGTSEVYSISEIAEMIKETVQYKGRLVFDTTKPDGMPIKTLDGSALLSLGWKSAFNLQSAIEITYKWFLTREDLH